MISFGYLDNYLTWLLDIEYNQDREEVFSSFELVEGKRGERRQPRNPRAFLWKSEGPSHLHGKSPGTRLEGRFRHISTCSIS